MPSEKKASSVAPALEMAAVLSGVVGVFEIFSMTGFGVSLLGVATLLILVAWVIRQFDEKKQANAKLEGEAQVDPDVLQALRDEDMPIYIIRAVARVGSRESLEVFRDKVREQCASDITDITDEQIGTILRLVRVPAGTLPKPPTPVVQPTSTARDVAPPMDFRAPEGDAGAM